MVMADEGHYEKVGDIYEWRWNAGKEPKVTVPKGEFDPRDPKPEPPKAEPEPKPKPAPVVKVPAAEEVKRGPGRPRKVED